MNFERSLYEENGLKFDEDRVLTYSQLKCPMDRRYCFADDLNFNQKKNVAYLSAEQKELIEKLPEEISLIMLGCDTEFFQSRKNALETLERLVFLGKDLSVITKLHLDESFIAKLGEINKKLNAVGNLLALSVSVPCFDSAPIWEPKAPKPENRIETLKFAKAVGLKTMVAMRPLLPNVSNQELEKIILLTKEYSDGYYSGPLYLKEYDESVKNNFGLDGCSSELAQPKWMTPGNLFYKIEKPGQSDVLENILKKYGCSLFEGAADGIKHFKSEI